MRWFHRTSRRREELRRQRPETGELARFFRREGVSGSLLIALVFVLLASSIVALRPNVVPYRPGQFVPHDVVSRVDFTFHDADRYATAQQAARDAEPRVYRTVEDAWGRVEQQLQTLPARVAGLQVNQLTPPLDRLLDAATLAKLQEIAARSPDANWDESVRGYLEAIRKLDLVVLSDEDRREDIGRTIRLPDRGPVRAENALAPSMQEELAVKFTKPATEQFSNLLFPKIVQLTIALVSPTHALDESATVEARNAASQRVPPEAGNVLVRANMDLVKAGEIDQREWQLLRAENEAFNARVRGWMWLERLGLTGAVALLTVALSAYVWRFQPRIVRNNARGIGVAALLLAMLLLAQLTGMGTSQLYVFAVTPTILVAMVLAIAYDQRFAFGVATVHAVLVTLGLAQPLTFFLVVWLGAMACCYLLDDVRTRDKLIRVGGGAALALAAATLVAALIAGDPIHYALRHAIYAATAGLAAGFVLLGILPFIEKTFRITTSMSLLELADASHPLLRRLAIEAPGTWSHSVNVASLAEEAAEAIGANSLLCRVGAYYHDVGKITKSDYFVENQQGGQNRHLSLSPSVSLLIIVGHVKDGIELAREYNLPTVLHAFIQQHHGTTLVEFFYHQACTRQGQADPDAPAVSETQYRYPGPKPRSKEVGILMLCDAVESACRAMVDPSASRIETVVHEIALKRLLDGQFDECDLTMRELELIERSLVKTLLGIYHGRIAYPSTQAITQGNAPAVLTPAAAGSEAQSA
jgi:putative nucleotidyltransferase with HDIG domain